MSQASFIRVVFRIKKLWTCEPAAAVLCVQPVTDEGDMIQGEPLYTSFMGANMWLTEVRLIIVNPKDETRLEQEDFVRLLCTGESPVLVDLVFNIPGDNLVTMKSSLTPSGDAVNVSVHIPMMKIEKGGVTPLQMLCPMAKCNSRLTTAVGYSDGKAIIAEEDLDMPTISKNFLHGRYPGLYILHSDEEVTGPLIGTDISTFCPGKDGTMKVYSRKRFLRCLAYAMLMIVTVTIICLCVWFANKSEN